MIVGHPLQQRQRLVNFRFIQGRRILFQFFADRLDFGKNRFPIINRNAHIIQCFTQAFLNLQENFRVRLFINLEMHNTLEHAFLLGPGLALKRLNAVPFFIAFDVNNRMNNLMNGQTATV